MIAFSERLNRAIQEKDSCVCVGLDPRLELLPRFLVEDAQKKYGVTLEAAGAAIAEFNCRVIEAVADVVPVIKPQVAFYEQYGIPGLQALQVTIHCAREHGLLVIADAKRSDIDSTAQAYANAWIGHTDLGGTSVASWSVDAMTVNPFLGYDSVEPFVQVAEESGTGIFVLVKTSNPGSGDLQDLRVDDETISVRIVRQLATAAHKQLDSFGYSGVGAVVGATYPEHARELRQVLPHSILLVPGVGAQGATPEQLAPFFQDDGLGAIVNSSRGIVFAFDSQDEKNFAMSARSEAKVLSQAVNQVRKQS